MTSQERLGQRLYDRMNKKGQIIDTTTGVVISLFVFILIVFAILLGISSLNPGSFFTAGSAEQNATNQLTRNVTEGVSQFGAQIPTFMKVLGITLILAGIALLIVIVVRFRSQAGGTGGSL